MASNNNDFRLELYRQSWEQARHNETLRGTYTAFVAAIVVGALTFSREDSDSLQWLAVLLAALSFSAFMVSLRTWMTTRRWLVTQLRVQRDLNLSWDVAQRPRSSGRFWSRMLGFTDSIVRVDLTFILLHFIGTGLFVAMHVMNFSFSEGFQVIRWEGYTIVGGVMALMSVLWFLMWRLVKFYERSALLDAQVARRQQERSVDLAQASAARYEAKTSLIKRAATMAALHCLLYRDRLEIQGVFLILLGLVVHLQSATPRL